MNRPKPGYYLALLACAMAVVVVGLGAFTRLVDAGLGCPDWPTCYGHMLWPDSHEEISAANAHPDFLDTPVESDKTWPEQVHRIFASSLGLLGLALFGIALKHREARHPWKSTVALLLVLIGGTVARIVYGDGLDPYLWLLMAAYFGLLGYQATRFGTSPMPLKLPAFIAGFLILQGLFGMWTVTLKLWPQVVTAHLLGGFAVFSLLWLLVLRLGNAPWRLRLEEVAVSRSFKTFAAVGLVVVIVQIALGGWTTSNYADVACPDLPTCQNEWLPPMNFSDGFNVFQHVGPNYLGGTLDNDARVAIHFSHRVGAIVTALVLILLIIRLRSSGVHELRRFGGWVLFVLIAQFCLGLSNVAFKFPIGVAVAHNLVGALLLLTMVTLNYRLHTAQPRRGEAET